MPPITSPITCGWPRARSATPSRRDTARMTRMSTVMTLSRRSGDINGRPRGEPPHLGHRHAAVRLVLETDDAPASVAVARRAEEDDERPGRGVAHGAHQALEHDGRARDAEHA